MRRSAEEAAVASAGAFSTNAAQQRLPPTLTATVVGGMVGAGVFPLPRNVAEATGAYGAVPWAIVGAGILLLAFVFQTQAKRKPGVSSCAVQVRAVHGLLVSLRILGQCPGGDVSH